MASVRSCVGGASRSGAPNRTSTGRPRAQVGPRDAAVDRDARGHEPLAAPHRDRHQRRARSRGPAPRRRASAPARCRSRRCRPRGRRRRPRPRASSAAARRYAAAGACAVDRDVPHRRPSPGATTRDVPDVVAAHEADRPLAGEPGLADEQEVGERDVVGWPAATGPVGGRCSAPRARGWSGRGRACAAVPTRPRHDRRAVRRARPRQANGGRCVARQRAATGPAPDPGRAVAVLVGDQVAHPAQRQRHQPVRAHPGRAERGQQPRHGHQAGQPAGDREGLAVVVAQQGRPGGGEVVRPRPSSRRPAGRSRGRSRCPRR